ncbi:MAG: hypothetical protein H7323_10410 [Frankiales bacterium]|nr:hypothetical protein [Frankiales bacterium]
MTDTLQRSRPSMPPRRVAGPEPTRSLPVAGARAALLAALLGLVAVAAPVLLVWASDARAGAGVLDAIRMAGQLWLVAHGVSLEVPGGSLGLTPLALLALPLWLVARAGRGLARSHGDATLPRLVAAVAGPYAVVVGVVAAAAPTPGVRAGVVPAVLAAAVLGLLGAASGVARERGLRVPERVRPLLHAAGLATATLLGAGALLAGGALAWHLPRAAELARASDPGPVGGVALLLLGLSLVPNAVVWGASFLAGPGFAVGVGTAVGPFGHELGPVPAFPLLGGLPSDGVPGWVGLLALAVPLLAGVLAGAVLVRLRPGTGRSRTLLEAVVVGPATGLVLGLAAWTSGGAVGGGRLAEVGPGEAAVFLAVTALVGAGSLAGAAVQHHRIARDDAGPGN